MATFERAVMRNLECPICCSLLTQPKQLACTHTFCEACLMRLLSAQLRPGFIACPVCRRDTAVGDDGVPSLPTNFPVKGIVSDVKVRVQYCNNCDDEIEGEYYCSNCEHYLCNACHDIHGKLRRNADHVVVSADDVKRGKVLLKRRVLCQEHKAGEGEYECTDVCITCKKFICMRCRMLIHGQNNHEVKSAVEYQELHSHGADSLATQTETKMSDVMKHRELIVAEEEKVVTHIAELGNKIDKAYDDAIRRLKEDKQALNMKCQTEKEKLLRELNEMKIKDDSLVEILINANSLVIDSSQTPLEESTVVIREALCEQLTQVLNEEDPSIARVREVSERARKLNYEHNPKLTGITLGNVQYQEWNSKDDVALSSANTMECMAATPDGRMAVGCSKGERGIEIYSADGQLQQRALNGLHVAGIGFLSNGRCAVRDLGNSNKNTITLALYTDEWEKINVRFETLSFDEGGHGHLTIDSDDHIYVGYTQAKRIQVFTPAGGKPIREIACDRYKPQQIFAMKAHKMMLVNTSKNVSRTMDPSGEHLIERKNVKKSADYYVYPAVCKDDTILIATVNKEKDSVTIERYTSELQHMASLITDQVIQQSERRWCFLQEFASGKVAFCTPDRLYMFSESVTPVSD